MEYLKLASSIPTSKRETVSDKLIDIVLTTKNDNKLPSRLASNLLRHWQNDDLKNESGLATLLEAAVLVESEKTISTLNELQIADVGEQIKQLVAP